MESAIHLQYTYPLCDENCLHMHSLGAPVCLLAIAHHSHHAFGLHLQASMIEQGMENLLEHQARLVPLQWKHASADGLVADACI